MSLVFAQLIYHKLFNPDNEILQLAGEFRRKYQIPLLDCIIAATIHKIDTYLLTKNVKDLKN